MFHSHIQTCLPITKHDSNLQMISTEISLAFTNLYEAEDLSQGCVYIVPGSIVQNCLGREAAWSHCWGFLLQLTHVASEQTQLAQSPGWRCPDLPGLDLFGWHCRMSHRHNQYFHNVLSWTAKNGRVLEQNLCKSFALPGKPWLKIHHLSYTRMLFLYWSACEAEDVE